MGTTTPAIEDRTEAADEFASEVLSPELALVDPELRRLAQRRLQHADAAVVLEPTTRASEQDRGAAAGDPSAWTVDLEDRAGVGRPAIQEELPAHEVAEPWHVEEGRRSARRGGTRRKALPILFAVAAGALLFAWRHADTRVTPARDVRPEPDSGVGAPRTGETSRHERTTTRARTTSRKTRAKVAAPSRRRRSPAKKRRSSTRKRPASAAKSTRSTRKAAPVRQKHVSATRIFVWPAAARVTFYDVAFYRGGKKIFEASTSAPRLALPARWVFKGRRFRLTPGTYQWIVRPVTGSRLRPHYGSAITRSKWTLTKTLPRHG